MKKKFYLILTSLLTFSVVILGAAPSRAEEAEHPSVNLPALVPNDGGEVTDPRSPLPEDRPVTSPPPAAVGTAQVLEAVDGLRGLSSWTVIPFVHLRRGQRHVVVVWAAINSSGQLVDATVVGICLNETAQGGLEECGRRWVVRERAASQAALVQALGGSDYEVVAGPQGAPLDDLGAELGRLGTSFSEAISRTDRVAARTAAQEFSRLLPLDRLISDNSVAQLLWLAATHRGRLQHVRTVRQGDEALLTLHVLRGRQRMRTIEARARPLASGSSRWIITSYR